LRHGIRHRITTSAERDEIVDEPEGDACARIKEDSR